MSWSDRFRDIALGILTGGLYTAGHAVGEAVGDALQGGTNASTSVSSAGAGRALAPPPPSRPIPAGASGPCGGPAAGGTGVAASAPPCCCDRFRFQDGFLVDGSTGHAWRYNERSRSFDEVPLRPVDAKKALMEALLEEKLRQMQQEYDSEVLGTLPANLRARQRRAFEKQYVQPLRTAAVSTRP